MNKKRIFSLVGHILAVILLDALLLGIILLGFAYMHHGKAYLEAYFDNRNNSSILATTPAKTTSAPTTLPAVTPGITSPGDTTAAVDNRTQWQIKYADKFTDDIVITENSYTSPNISIHIDTVSPVYLTDWQ